MSKTRPIEASLRTNQGQVRDHNEDFVICHEPATSEEAQQNGWLYIVADGVGGADAGEVASQFASERTIDHYLANQEEPDRGQRLQQAMQAANTDLRQMVVDKQDHSRMATTMVAAVIDDDQVYISNVGDSRGYHWRQGEMRQITRDHSLVAKLLEEGAITAEEAEHHPRKNVILYSLGSENTPQIDVFEITLQAGDLLLLCSDGLTRHVGDDELQTMLGQYTPDEATERFIALANQRGGEDNISACVIRYGGASSNATAATMPTMLEDTVKVDTTPKAQPLWAFTLLLSLVQTILIVLVWLWLQV